MLPSVLGSSREFCEECISYTKRGYRCVVFNRRGLAGDKLTTAKFNLFGEVDDTVA